VDPSVWHARAAAAKPSGLAPDPSVHTALLHAAIEDLGRCATAAGCGGLEPGLDRMLVADPHYPVPDLREDQSSALPKDAQLRVDFDPDALAEYGLGRPERGRHPAERLERVGLSEILAVRNIATPAQKATPGPDAD
jgi:hypothetical protein